MLMQGFKYKSTRASLDGANPCIFIHKTNVLMFFTNVLMFRNIRTSVVNTRRPVSNPFKT